jgi:signal transduction histidine kinase
MEWFDQGKLLLGREGTFFPETIPQLGIRSLDSSDRPPLPLRSLTLRLQIERTPDQLPLEGYLRISQSLVDMEKRAEKRLWTILWASFGTFVLVMMVGIGLTQKAVTPAEKMVQQLKQFTADASHELRSPLTAIQNSVDGLRNHTERLHPQDIQRVGIIGHATEQMTHLIRDLLFLARSDVEMEHPQSLWTVFELNRLFSDLEEWLTPVAEEKAIELRWEVESSAWVRGDRSQLSRLFVNLIENAINYTPQNGHVTVTIHILRQRIRITVADTGIGIAPDQIPYVFDRFWRSEQAREYRSQGTGLGLAIAHAIAKGHQGQITVTSQLYVGTCFTVYLPLHLPPLTH